MNRAPEYFERSDAYAAAAEVALEPGSKARLLQLAQHWAHLGQIAARNDERSEALSPLATAAAPASGSDGGR
jgi:hypothetical protein